MASPIVAFSTLSIRSVHSTPSRKRQRTPFIEASSSKRSLVLTTPQKRPPNLGTGSQIPPQPFFAPKKLFPGGPASEQVLQKTLMPTSYLSKAFLPQYNKYADMFISHST